ncbi:hypothetical protein Tco_0946117 [Tanacetum coccineum]
MRDIPPQKRTCSSPSNIDFTLLLWIFEKGESSWVADVRQPDLTAILTQPERHEEEIETVMNHLDGLPLDRIEKIEGDIEEIERQGQIRTEIPELHARNRMTSQSMWRFREELIVARSRISVMEARLEAVQARQQEDTQRLLNHIIELQKHQGGSSSTA